MKKILFIAVLLIYGISSSQDYIPLLQEDNAWSVDVLWSDFGGNLWIETQQITISGTATFNNKTYQIINNNDGASCYLREENKKIYFYSELNDNEFILYDFDLQLGDSFSLPTQEIFTCTYGEGYYQLENAEVTNITTVFVAGENRKMIEFNYYAPLFGQEFWIEGIGSLRGIEPGGNFESDGLGGTNLVCFSKNGETTFFNDATSCDNTTLSINNHELLKNILVYPNPINKTSLLQLPLEAEIDQLVIYDIYGRMINDETITREYYTLKAMNYPSGLYLYQVLRKGNIIKTDQFIVK